MNKLTMSDLQKLAELAPTTRVKVPLECGQIVGHYYSFLYLLVSEAQPSLIVELGTGREARSAAHFAAGSRFAKVIGIDFEPPNFTPYPNIEWWMGDTRFMDRRIADLKMPIDILFIDSTHEADHALIELGLYWQFMRSGSILLVDDINLGNMRSFWEAVPEPKVYSSTLHDNCGFGFAIKE